MLATKRSSASICDSEAQVPCVAEKTYWRFRGREGADRGNFSTLLEEHTARGQLYNFLPLSRCHQTSSLVTSSLSHQPPAVLIQKPSVPSQLHFRNQGQLCLLRSWGSAHPCHPSGCSHLLPAIHRHGLLSDLATLWKSLLSSVCLARHPPKTPVTHQALCENKI